MGWIIAAAVLAALLLVYVFLLMPRLAGRPDMTPLRAVQYAHRGLHDNRSDAPENSLKAFRLAVEQRLTDTGFSTAVTVANPGEGPLPFCLGAHTGFRCPLEAGERFEDYELVFPERESCPTLLLRDGLLDRPAALPCLEDTDTLPLDYRWFDALDTLIFEGLRSRSVTLRSRKSGRGVRVSFDGFPMLAFWTMPGKKAPYLCIEPWHGCAAGTAEGPEFTDKAHCIVLAPGESRTLAYRADTL